MIKYNPKTWVNLIFHSYSRHVLRVLMPSLLFMLVYTFIICYLFVDYFEFEYRSTTAFHSLLGVVLGLVLVFRKNSAYDRWWEGRKHWGALVNNTRNLAIKINAFLPEERKDDRAFFEKMIPNFVFALKEHLREGTNPEELEEVGSSFMNRLKKATHQPNFIVSELYMRFSGLHRGKVIDGEQFFIMDKELATFLDIQGACERIRNTPIPYSYSMFVKKFIFIYTITLPFGFVPVFAYWTIPIVVLLFLTFLSIELIAEEIEDPFGKDVNDLPTDDLAVKIRNNVREIFS
ncbi:MAG: hypothetical protein OEX02_17525, partial [Cyclobacteriaceae bacterium]|nr:hypothetical protein [Cyclobacteriaceae bacterium]